MRFVSRRERNRHNVNRAHSQLLPGTNQTDAPHIADGTFAGTARENAMKVRDGESCKVCQKFSIQRLVKVLANIALHLRDAFLMNKVVQCFSSHEATISFSALNRLVLSYHVQILLLSHDTLQIANCKLRLSQ